MGRCLSLSLVFVIYFFMSQHIEMNKRKISMAFSFTGRHRLYWKGNRLNEIEIFSSGAPSHRQMQVETGDFHTYCELKTVFSNLLLRERMKTD